MQVTMNNIYDWMENYGMGNYTLDAPSYQKMMDLMNLTDKIARIGEGTRRSIWIKVPGNNGKDEWINIAFRGACYAPGDVYYEVQINDITVLEYDSKRSNGDALDFSSMLDWLIEKVSDVIAMAENDEYGTYISDVPYYQRQGAIRRADYYAIVPGAKEKCGSSLDQSEIKELLESEGTTEFFEEALTVRRYYEACAVAYEALGIDRPEDLQKPRGMLMDGWHDDETERSRYGGLTPKEWYYNLADGRDDGMCLLPMDDADAFIKWQWHQKPYFKPEYYGGHPWDFIFKYSGSFMLYVESDPESGRSKLIVAGDSADRSSDIIRAFLALRKAGYAVELKGFKVLTDRILEKDYLGVVKEVYPAGLGDTIAGHFVRDEISLFQINDDEVVDKIIQATEWEDINEVALEMRA